MADLIPPMLIKLQADVTQLKVGLAQAESALQGVDKSVATASNGMTNFIGKMKQVGASIGIAFAGTQVLQFGRDVIQQAMEAEAQQQRLAQLMKVTVGATDEQIASLNAQADALEKVGVITGGNITQTQSQLATFNLQTDTIKKLTPAILDYVTAEKGANASADEFKQMTNGLAQALNGNFGSLTRVGFVLDDHTKKLISSGTEAERAAAIVDVLDSTYKGFNESLRDTPEGQMQGLINDFNKLKEDLGKALLPALRAFMSFLTSTVIPTLRTFGKLIADNAEALKMYAGIVLGGAAAFYVVRGAMIATKAVMVVYTAVTKSMAAGHTLAAIATLNFRGAMMMLNMAIRANPIGAIITALTVLGAAFVFAWKKSETFRGIVIKGVQIVLTGFAYLVQGIGKFIGMLAKVPGMGWAKGIADGAKKASDSIKETSKNLSDLKSSVKSGYGEGAFTYGSGTGSGGGGGGGGGGGLDDKAKKKLEGYKKDVAKIYNDMNKVIAEAQEKAQEALEARNEKMFDAHKKYDERVADLKKRFREANDEADKRFEDAKADALNRRNKAETEANKRFREVTDAIEKDYADKKADLLKANNEKLDDIRKKAADKTLDLIQAAAEKQSNILQQSIDRLRNAFASKTKFDLGEVFKGGADTADKLLADLKEKLAAAKQLQANAAALAGAGYSQVFIEEVVKQGPEAGNKIAEALKAASPEATKELQDLYNQVETVSEHGLDALAKTMNAGGKLATEELMVSFNKVSADLKQSLSAVNTEMNEALADANKAYSEAMTEAEVVRKEKMADANKTLLEALADTKATYDEALAEATKALTEARADAQKNLSEGLAEAQKTLQEALTEAQKAYEDAIDEINKATQEKLDALMEKLREVAALMAELGAKNASLNALKNAPNYDEIVPETYGPPVQVSPGVTVIPTSDASDETINAAAAAAVKLVGGSTNVTVNGVNLTDPNGTASALVSIIKYGQTVRVATSLANGLDITGIKAAQYGFQGAAK